jgi:type I restriction enzyme, R subunit
MLVERRFCACPDYHLAYEIIMTPEEKARQQIDQLLRCAGWTVQDRTAMNLFDPAAPGVAVREAHLRTGYADYLLFVEG